MSGPIGRTRLLGREPLPFVNRESLIANVLGFHKGLKDADAGVVVLHGVGGMGKTRLANEIFGSLHPATPRACIDLFLPQLRGFDSALLTLRRGLVSSLGHGAFPAFDVAFAHYWQLTHPGSAKSATELPFLDESEILNDIVGSLANIPLIGGIIATLKLGAKLHTSAKSRQTLKDPVLLQVIQMPLSEMARSLPELFGYDLSRATKETRPLIIIDTVEALLGDRPMVDGTSAAEWLDAVISSAHGVTWMLLSRDPLRWAPGPLPDGSPGTLRTLELEVGPLEQEHVDELMSRTGLDNGELTTHVYESSQGHPYFIELWLENYRKSAETGHLDFAGSGVDRDRLVSRFLGHLEDDEQHTLVLLSALAWFDDRWVDAVREFATLPRSTSMLDRFGASTLCRQVGDRRLAIDPLVADCLCTRLQRAAPSGYYQFLAEYSARRVSELGDQPVSDDNQWLILESLRLSMAADELPGGLVEGAFLLAEARSPGSAEQGLRALLRESDAAKDAYWLATGVLSRILRIRGRLEEAEQLLSTKQFPMVLRPDLELELAETRREYGKPRAAVLLYERVMSIALPGSRQRVAAALSLVDRQVILGQYRRAMHELDVLETQSLDHEPLPGLLLRHRGQALRAAGAPTQTTLQAFSGAWEVFTTIGDEYNQGRILTDVADTLCGVDAERALRAANRATEIHRKVGAAVEAGKSLTYGAVAAFMLDDPRGSGERLQEAEDLLRWVGYRSGLDRILITRAAMALVADQRETASSLADEAIDSVERRDSHRRINLLARVLIRLSGHESSAQKRGLAELLDTIEWLPETVSGPFGVPRSYFRTLLVSPAHPSLRVV